MNNRKPDTQLAEAIRNLQKEIDDKAIILKALRAQYDPEEVDYYEYIKTEAWEEMRQKVFRRDGFQCVICKEAKNLNVHHITYERLGCEDLADLVTLCQKCHEKVHRLEDKTEKDKAGTVPLGTVKMTLREAFELCEKNMETTNPRDIFTYRELELLQCAYEMGEAYATSVPPMVPDYFEKIRAREIIADFNEGQGLPKWISSFFDNSPIFRGSKPDHVFELIVAVDYFKAVFAQVADAAISKQIENVLFDFNNTEGDYKELARKKLCDLSEQRDALIKEMRSL